MGEVIDLRKERLRRAGREGLKRWGRRLGYEGHPLVCPSELPEIVLWRLGELDETATLALYDLVMGARGWGAAEGFAYLDPSRKIEALDSFLVLADQLRFELMARLGWVGEWAGRHTPLVEMALEPGQFKPGNPLAVPPLLPSYPHYHHLKRRLALEPEAVVRSLIPGALRAFRKKVLKG